MSLAKALANIAIEQIGTYQNIPDVLLVSAQHNNGIFLFANGQVQRVKRGSVSGIWVENDALYYAYVCYDHLRVGQFGAEGERVHLVNTDLGDIHDIRFFNGEMYVVSTVTNEISVLSDTGRLTRRIKFPGCGDAWHLNCLDLWNGRLVVSAFGAFDWHRQWKGNYKGKGMVVDVETREVLWTGLSQPHSPRMLPDSVKCICDSQAQRLIVDRAGELTNVDFPNKYPRGLSFGEKNLYVGLSQARRVDMLKAEEAKAGLAVVDRSSLKMTDFVPLPVVEIYDVLVIPP